MKKTVSPISFQLGALLNLRPDCPAHHADTRISCLFYDAMASGKARSFTKIFCQILIAIIFISVLARADIFAAQAMAVDQDDAYSGKVLDKIVRKWNPPNRNKYEGTLKIVIALDDEGNLLSCKVRQSSGLDGADASVCAAVKAASPFGPPPYGIPTDLYLAFWAGNQPAMKDEDPRLAKLRAEQEAQAAAQKSPDTEKYLANATWKVRNSIYVPKEAPPGVYNVTAKINCDSTGKILSSEIVRGSGNDIVDKYVRQGIKRAGSVPPPPKSLGKAFDLTFKLVR